VASAIPDDAIQGKAGYMSPEAAHGENIDARADLFSVGIILWELLSGRRLYKGEKGKAPPLALAQQADIPELSLPGIPGETALKRIVERALQKDIAGRYQNAAELRRDLDQYLHEQGLIASPLKLGRWLREQCTPEVIERRRALEQAVLASSSDFAAENTDHSHITPAHREASAGVGDRPDTGRPDAGRDASTRSDEPMDAPAAGSGGPKARNVALFVVIVVVAFLLGVLVRLR
jgi:serine/threonine-protein kinase